MHIILIIDESGSMDCIRTDVLGSLNQFIRTQKKLSLSPPQQSPSSDFVVVNGSEEEDKDNATTVSIADDTLTIVKFNSNITYVRSAEKIADANELKPEDYMPHDMTRLYDAIGDVCTKFQKEKNVVLAIMTDGEENSSREYNYQQVKNMLDERREKNSWNIVYLSAGLTEREKQTNYAQGVSLGVTGSSNCFVGKDQFADNMAGACNTFIGFTRQARGKKSAKTGKPLVSLASAQTMSDKECASNGIDLHA